MLRIAAVLIALVALAACGSNAGSGAGEATARPVDGGGSVTPEVAASADRRAQAAARRGTRIRAIGSQFGSIAGDGRGQAVYVFDRERHGRSECYGACAKAWPPVLAHGRPVAGRGVRAARLGTTRRRDGRRQVTLAGRPLYLYVADSPGRVLCHGVREFGGLWLVVRPDGSVVPS